MITSENQIRINEMKDAPLSWKENDLLTAAEKYLKQSISFPMVSFLMPGTPNLSDDQKKKIAQIWRCTSVTYHLHTKAQHLENKSTDDILLKTARIYEVESQRLLGALFSLQHDFWKTFYIRQQAENEKMLIALDALYFITNRKEHIHYQLLEQSLRAIIQAYYSEGPIRNAGFEKALRLIIDLELPALKNWVSQKLQH